MRVGVLVSGTGSLLDAFLAAGVPVVVVLADRPCPALARAERAGVATELVERDRYDAGFDREAYSALVAQRLQAHGVELVAMAGFGTILGRAAHDTYGGRLLNTHPALLPAYKGWHAVRDALADGATVTGCTVHVAGLEVDTGPVLAQEEVPVLPGDDEARLHERIKAVERRLYPETVLAVIARGSVLPPGAGVAPEPPSPTAQEA
ncbi:MAG TPA: phosphoribosylglycinamide formyltransferase [Acidimicrobiales bacterium]|nr:phosphoribosylglycinamide formyltransferase [Acidimicrobiales bacterium]